jgi:hypothetical protein
LLGGVTQLLHLVQTASTDDADSWRIFFHLLSDLIEKTDPLESR